MVLYSRNLVDDCCCAAGGAMVIMYDPTNKAKKSKWNTIGNKYLHEFFFV